MSPEEINLTEDLDLDLDKPPIIGGLETAMSDDSLLNTHDYYRALWGVEDYPTIRRLLLDVTDRALHVSYLTLDTVFKCFVVPGSGREGVEPFDYLLITSIYAWLSYHLAPKYGEYCSYTPHELENYDPSLPPVLPWVLK